MRIYQILLIAFLSFFVNENLIAQCSGSYTTDGTSCQNFVVGDGTPGYIKVTLVNNNIPSGGGTKCGPGGTCDPPFSGGGWDPRISVYTSDGTLGYSGSLIGSFDASDCEPSFIFGTGNNGYAEIVGICLSAGTIISWTTINACGDIVCAPNVPPACGGTICPTCSNNCEACGFAPGTVPTPSQLVCTCGNAYPFLPPPCNGQAVTKCASFQAEIPDVTFQVIVTSNCLGGNVTNFTWDLFNYPSCGSSIQSGNLSDLVFNGLTIGNDYVYCYYFNVPAGCCHSSHTPYFIGACSDGTADAGSPVSVCAGSTINLNGSFGGGASSATWSGPSGTFGNVNSPTSSYTPSISSGTVTLTLTTNDPPGSCVAATSTVTITVISLALAGNVTNACGGNNGAIDITATGGGSLTYDWADVGGPSNPADRTGLSVGSYTVTVTSSLGCKTVSTFSIINSGASVSISGNSSLCSGSSITLASSLSGVYNWSTGANTSSISVTTAGTYTVTVTNGACKTTASKVISVTTVTATIAGATTMCSGGSTTLTASGGGTYAWSNGRVTAANNITAAGTYTVTVTNNGCTSTAQSIVTLTTVTATISGSTTMCAGVGGSTTLTASGGGTYVWNSGSITAANNITAAGTYTVTVTNSSCTSTAQSTVTLTTITATISGATTMCAGVGGSTTLTASGGGTYVWSSGAVTAANNITAAGIYTVTVTNSGCTSTAQSTVTLTTITATISGATTMCAGVGGSTTLTASGGGTYVWSSGAVTAANNITAAGTYTVTVTNSGCTSTAQSTVTLTTVTAAISGATTM